jgi:hypothetical protein
MPQMDKVRRRITRAEWDGLRVAFNRVVLFDRFMTINMAKWQPRYVAAREELFRRFAPLTKKDKAIIRNSVRKAELLDTDPYCDTMIFDLGIAL